MNNSAAEHLGATKKAKTDAKAGGKFASKPGASGAWDPEPMASPTKGILVTPGTTATRRKTVSFGSKERLAQGIAENAAIDHAEPIVDPALTPYKDGPEAPTAGQTRHSGLTQKLIELSKQSSDQHRSSKETGLQSLDDYPAPAPDEREELMVDPDTTVDLSKPRSRSGQHWKAEFEGFHKRSTREMKNVIQYSQNHKSYAMTKDAEATSLEQRLGKELAKVASMERKVSKLAKQLETAKARGPAEHGDLAKLVNELSQQTARAIRYKQKVDRYEATLQKQVSAENSAKKEIHGGFQAATDDYEEAQDQASLLVAKSHRSDSTGLQAQLESLRECARISEDAAIRLEFENSALKRTLARVKEEMMSYETRRQAREEHLKRREASQQVAREEAETQLAKLTIEHTALLQATSGKTQHTSGTVPLPTDINGLVTGLDEEPKLAGEAPAEDNVQARPTVDHNQARPQSKSSHKRPSQNAAVDIWTFSSPKDIPDNQTPKEVTELSPSSVRQDIKRTLREISDNLVPDQPPKTILETKSPLQKLQLTPNPTKRPTDQASATRRTHTRKPISSPRPSIINLTSSPAKLQPSQGQQAEPSRPRASQATVGRSASLMSRVGNRSVMSSARGSVLPAERAAAARARLARRSVEKKRQRESVLE